MQARIIVVAVVLAAAFGASPAGAAVPAPATPAVIDAEAIEGADEIVDVAGYLALRARQLDEAERGQHGRIPKPDMERLRYAYATMANLLEGRSSALELNATQRVELFNAQETISGILTEQAASAVVCERVRSTGSNIRQTRCATKAQRDLHRDAQQQGVLRTNHRDPGICPDPTRCN